MTSEGSFRLEDDQVVVLVQSPGRSETGDAPSNYRDSRSHSVFSEPSVGSDDGLVRFFRKAEGMTIHRAEDTE